MPREDLDLARYYTQEVELGEGQAMPRRDMHPVVAKGLGINPDKPLDMDQINSLLAGRRADGEKIEGKQYTRIKTYTDRRTGERKESVPIGAVDFCLTPDKSVSVAWAFATPAEQAAIYQAHRDAAHDTLQYIEQEVAKARIGKGGAGGYDQGHLGWVAFDHYTSRPTIDIVTDENGQRSTERVTIQVAGDPELHTHFTVTNAIFCENGRVGSLDLDRLKGLVKEAGALYQAHIATNLRNMGADVELDRGTGAARLTAIPEDVRTHYSKRTANGEQSARDFARAQGLDWDSLTTERRAGLLKGAVQGFQKGVDDETQAKLRKDDMADFGEWKRQAAELGWKHETIVTNTGPKQEIDRQQRIDRAYDEALPWLEKELDKRAVISEHDARTAAARGLIATGIESAADLDRIVSEFQARGVRQHGEMTSLIVGQEDGKHGRSMTSGLHESQEKEFVFRVKAAAADLSAALPAGQIKAAVDRAGLNFGSEHGQRQLAAVHSLGEGGRIGITIGAAGAGKTSLLKPLVDAWKETGRDVHGIALAWRQADDLVDAGIKRENAKALSVFFQAVQKGDVVLDSKSVVVVDELSLLGTRQGLDLLRLQEKHGYQLVMIGDDKQCQSIEAGPIIGLLRQALGPEMVPEIHTTVRQQTDRERDIVGAFRGGRVAEAIAMKREDGTVELVPGGYREVAERTASLLADRIKANRDDPKFSITVSAPTNRDAYQISLAIRETRREMGELGRDMVKIGAADRDGTGYDMKLAKGDRVRLFHSVAAEGQRGGSIGRNGSILIVVSADKQGMTVRNAKGTEGYVPWKSLTRDGQIRLAYGEVMTTYTAQGSTSTEHIYAMPAGTKLVTGHSAYSSGTRHKQQSFILISEGAERAEVAGRRSVGNSRPISKDNLWNNVVRNLGRQAEKMTATDFLAKATNLKRGAVRAFQKGLQPGELRQRRGLEPRTANRTMQQRREAHGVEKIVSQLQAIAKELAPVVARLSDIGQQIAVAVERSVDRTMGRTRGQEGQFRKQTISRSR
ncbi:hypothetical protein SAE02_71820 [Skermanella aerolata]|uniref:TrwC relaxase domain-containing protein n=1 Tax=Skermanella aerolata TaxID=393310 RepID=A0A512E2U2_9PROT|nr:MobF family relaxase [Skermanella aerolata]GEO43034.1 hypothetical protein SAE02_71820 [Skermanella aerolata]